MLNLQHIKAELKNSITKGTGYLIGLLEEKLVSESPNFNSFVQIKIQFQEFEKGLIHGTASRTDLEIFHAEIVDSLLKLIDKLNLSDFRNIENQTYQTPLRFSKRKTILFISVTEINPSIPDDCGSLCPTPHFALPFKSSDSGLVFQKPVVPYASTKRASCQNY